MPDYEFFDPSDIAVTVKSHQFKAKYDFPFHLVPVGKSFAVGKNDVSSANGLRVLASRFGKKLNRVFRVVDHKEAGFEVYCINEAQSNNVSTSAYNYDDNLSEADNTKKAAAMFMVKKPADSYVDPEDNLPKWTPPKHD